MKPEETQAGRKLQAGGGGGDGPRGRGGMGKGMGLPWGDAGTESPGHPLSPRSRKQI